MSYHPQISHYKSQNAPNKRYLEPNLTISDTWEDYKSTHGNISYIMYQQVFQSENIGFGKPSQGDGVVCAKYRTHCKDLNRAHDVYSCEQCKVGQERKKKAERNTSAYQQ